jgi:uncharacterized membrane protein YjjB (DUF3815 family)
MSLEGVLLAAAWSFGASFCCAFYFNTNKYDILFGALLGAGGWVLYTLITAAGGSGSLGYLAGAFFVSLFSELFAIVIKNPATVYLLPGLLPLVPGGGMFQTMREAVQGHAEAALETGFVTGTAAGAIALGIALASSIARIWSLFMKNRMQIPPVGKQ